MNYPSSAFQLPPSTIASARRLKIGYVIWSLGLGGAEQVVVRLATECARRGHSVVVFTLNRPGLFADGLQKMGVPVISVSKHGPFDLGVIGRLAKEFRARSLDVVHTHLWGANLWGRLAARRARIPIIVATEHNVDTWKRFYHFLFDRALRRSTTHLIAVSHQVRQFYEAHGVGLGRWHVVYNGIDTDRVPARGRGRVYHTLGIGANEPVVGLIGRLVPAKAPGVFLEAVAIASRTIPELRALIVGDGPLHAEMKTQIRRSGLTSRVQMPGVRQDIPELLAGMDVLAFSSEREGLSIAMLEAMAAGVPVVATRVGGTPELITSGVTGLLVSSGSARELAAGIIDVLQHPARAEALRCAARARVEEQFALRAMADQHEALYRTAAPPAASPAKRICYVIDHLDIGGAQRQLVELVKRMPRQMWEPIVISLSTSRRALGDELAQAGVTVHYIPQGGALDLRCLKRLTRLLRLYHPAITQTCLFTADLYGRLAAWLAGAPICISSVRSIETDKPGHYIWADRLLAPLTDRFIANADCVKTMLQERERIRLDKITRIYNGIPLNGVLPHRTHDGHVVIGSVGRLDRVKGYDVLLRAFARAREVDPRLCLLLVGDGSERPHLQALTRQLKIEAFVEFAGYRSDVEPWLQQMDYFVLPSRYEGCSNALLEAMAAGRPVIATRVGGSAELIEDGVSGLLVPPDDEEALAQALMRLCRDATAASHMASIARTHIQERFGIPRMIEETSRLYEELLQRPCISSAECANAKA